MKTIRIDAAALLIVLFTAATVSGCAASHVAWDAKTGIMNHGDARYAVTPPAGDWKPVSPRGSDLAFFDKNLDAIISSDSLCQPSEDPPLAALMMHLLIGFTDIKKQSEAVIPFDGREALKTEYSAKLDGVERRYLIYILKKDGCVYDLVYHAPSAKFDQGKPGFETFVSSFRTVK